MPSTTVKKGYDGASIVCCYCQHDAKFQKHADKNLHCLLGRIRLSRPYYYCKECHQGCFPWDRILGLSDRKVTPATAEVAALAGTLCDFEGGRRTLAKMSGLDLSEPSLRRITEDAGAKLTAAMDTGDVFEPEEHWDWSIDAHGKRCGYIGVDGIHVAMQGTNGSQAQTRVAYVGRLYNHSGDIAAPDQPHDMDTRYVAGFQSLDETCRHLRQHHDRVGGNTVNHLICITDGGNGIAEALQRRFFWTTWILDFWHAAEYLQNLAQALYPAEDKERQEWVETWRHALKQEGGKKILDRLLALDQTNWSATAVQAWTEVTRYYKNQLSGMDYPRYVSNGWQIGSGPTEAACKTVIASRLKRSGMRWVEHGADTVSHLRALYLNGESGWNRFWSPSLN